MPTISGDLGQSTKFIKFPDLEKGYNVQAQALRQRWKKKSTSSSSAVTSAEGVDE